MTTWNVSLTINNVNYSNRLIGELYIEREQSTAAIARFEIAAQELGLLDVTSFVGKPVIIEVSGHNDYTNTNDTKRLFTGLVDNPSFNLANKSIIFDCTDNLQQVVKSKFEDNTIWSTTGSPIFTPNVYADSYFLGFMYGRGFWYFVDDVYTNPYPVDTQNFTNFESGYNEGMNAPDADAYWVGEAHKDGYAAAVSNSAINTALTGDSYYAYMTGWCFGYAWSEGLSAPVSPFLQSFGYKRDSQSYIDGFNQTVNWDTYPYEMIGAVWPDYLEMYNYCNGYFNSGSSNAKVHPASSYIVNQTPDGNGFVSINISLLGITSTNDSVQLVMNSPFMSDYIVVIPHTIEQVGADYFIKYNHALYAADLLQTSEYYRPYIYYTVAA